MNPPYFPPKSDWQSPQLQQGQYQPYGQHGHYQQAWYEQTNRQISALFNSQEKLFERVCDRMDKIENKIEDVVASIHSSSPSSSGSSPKEKSQARVPTL